MNRAPNDIAQDRTTPRVLQAMAGALHGGAEAFFERLVAALHRAGLAQLVCIRRETARTARLAAGGLTVRELPFAGPLDLVTRCRLAGAIRTFRPSVVMSWMSRATRLVPPRFLSGGGHVHVARLGGYYDLKYYRRCDHLIGNTRKIVDYIRQQGWPASRAHYLPNFVDGAPTPPVTRGSLDTPAEAPLALALGRLHPNKGFDVLLRALAATPGLHLWLAGEGEERARLERLANELELGRRMRFLGWRDDAPALLAAADLLVCPSRHEPLGNVVIEAWAHGRPVVAAASDGPAALIDDGKSGLLTPVDDAAALAAALGRLVADREIRHRLAIGGRQAYEAEFTEAAVVRRYLRFFDEVSR